MTGATMHVIPTLDGGGAERLLTNLVTQTSGGHPAIVVCLRRQGVFREALEAAGIEVIDLGIRHRRTAIAGLFRLARIIRRRRPAVVQGWMYNANVFASLALRLAGRRGTQLMWGIFCSDVETDQYPSSSFPLFRRLARAFSPYVDGIVYNACQARDFHRSIGFREPRSLVIPNCIDTGAFRRMPALRQPVRRELGVPDDAVMVVMAARVDPMKNWNGVLAAVRDLPGVVTVAIGKGTDLLPPQPGFIGLGWRDDVQRVFSAADIFLLASVFGEGTSLALVEAMSCSLPCVVTDVGGNGTVIGDAGIVIPPRQIGPVRDALLRLAADRPSREQLGLAARARVATGHSADDVAAMLDGFSRSARGAA